MRTSQILLIFLIFNGLLFAQDHYELAPKFRLELSNPKDAVMHAYFGPDGERILLVGKESTQVWSARTGKLLLNFSEKIAHNDGLTIKWQPNGRKLLVFYRDAGKRSPALLFGVESGKQIAVLQGKKKAIHQADWSRDGKRILTFNTEKGQLDAIELSVWTENGKLINSIYEYNLRKPIFIDEGRKLLFDQGFSRKEKPIVIWDIERGRKVNSFDQPYKKRDAWNFATLLTISPDEKLVCGSPGISEGVICWETGGDGSVKYAYLDTKETGDNYLCGFSSDGKRFAVSKSKQNKIEFINSSTGKVESSIASPDSAGCGYVENYPFTSWSADDRFFITQNDDDKLSFWEVATGRQTGSFKLIDRRSFIDPNLDSDVLSFNPAKPILMSVSNKLLRLWNLKTGDLIRQLGKDEVGDRLKQIRSAHWSPDGSLLITGSKNKNAVLIWVIRRK